MDIRQNEVPIVQLKDICKTFGPTKALRHIDLTVYAGDVIGLVGANGAGKSTLMKILTGVYAPASGSIMLRGEDMSQHYSPVSAKKNGIACAYQELSLCTNLSIYENFLMKDPGHHLPEAPGWRKHAIKQAADLLDNIFPQSDIDVCQRLESLTLDKRQMVEICAAAAQPGLNVLILDEPTSSLMANRIEQLHETVRKLSKRGVAIIYISHKIEEIVRICNRVIILNSGQEVWSGAIADTSVQDLVKKMGGSVFEQTERAIVCSDAPDMVTIEHYSTDVLADVNLRIKKGEIVGISGLDGSGQRELLQAVFRAGSSRKHPGIRLFGKVAYISGDRSGEGVFPLWDIADNINIASFRNISMHGILSQKRCDSHAQHWYEKLKFKALGVNDNIMSLSGGNQQKALIARGLASDADIIVLNDPTCGVDVQTKKDIYGLLHEAAAAGRTIIWHSTEDLEMEQCDRVLIMQNGSVTGELMGEGISVQNIIASSFKQSAEQDDSIYMYSRPMQRKKNLIDSRLLMPVIVFLFIFAINAALRPSILSYAGIKLLFKSSVPLVFVGLGQMFIVLSGGMDLSNGMALGLVNVATAFILGTNPSVGLLYMFLIIAGYGAMGALIYATKIPPLVVTLGASYIWLGFGLMVSATPGGKCPEWLAAIYGFRMPVIPMSLLLALLGGFVAWWIVMRSKYGIILRGAGNNAMAVTRAGWSHRTAVIITYMISGLFVVLGGLFVTAVANGGDCNAYGSYQLLSIAAIVIGGCELSGGICSPLGVVIGALSLSNITTLLTFLSVNSNLQSAVTGAILLATLAFKSLSKRRVK